MSEKWYTKVKKCFSPTSPNYIATLVFQQLLRISKKDTHLNVSPNDQKGSEGQPVYDIVNAGPNHRFIAYSDVRDEGIPCHNCTLGLQFGMGYVSLAQKLTADTGRLVTEKESKDLINMHKKLYRVMWKWQDKQEAIYKKQGHYLLWGGWAILGDCENSLSFRNAPIQGHGSMIMQEAVLLAEERGVQILSPLHDAIYAEADEEHMERDKEILSDCMLQAVKNVLGDKLEIRLDVDVHTSDDIWIEGKGKTWYEKLHKYLERFETKEDRSEDLWNRIMGNRRYPHFNFQEN